MPSELKTERHGSILVLTISDPATRNTLSEQLLAAGIESLNVAGDDGSIRAIILRGDGPHFCAGEDLPSLHARRREGPAAQGHMLDALHQFVEVLRTIPKPVIAAVEGAATDAGFSLALACDLIVAAEDSRFALTQARQGLTPDGGATWQLTRSLPRPLVQQWIWLAEPVSARQLHAAGLVQSVTDSGHALAAALLLAERLSTMAPKALASAKELLHQATQQDFARQMESERSHLIGNLFHLDVDERCKRCGTGVRRISDSSVFSMKDTGVRRPRDNHEQTRSHSS